MKLSDIKVGDEFAAIIYHEYGCGIQSAFNYRVIRAGKRDVVCHAIRNGSPETWVGNGAAREYKFKRTDDVFTLDAPEIKTAREKITLSNRRAGCVKFLQSLNNSSLDDEFMSAIEAFKERVMK